MFTNVGDVHDHNTRQSEANLTLPKPKTNNMKNAISYRGAEVWNCLPASLRRMKNIDFYSFILLMMMSLHIKDRLWLQTTE